MKNLPNNWLVKETSLSVAEHAVKLIFKAAQQTIQEKGSFKLVLAGGTTPKFVYTLLAKEKCDWSNWHLYLGDERCLEKNDPERNSQMIITSFLDQIDIPETNVHFIPAELGAEKAASQYEATIESVLPFDLVLLGMGEDGHTASLFPSQSHNEIELAHAVSNAPKPPSERVSLSIKALSLNHLLLIIVTGTSKQDAAQAWIAGENLPVSRISSLVEKIVLLDKDAICN